MNSVLLFSLHLLWKQLRLMTIAFETEGINYNTKAADIVSHFSNLYIITMSSSVALLLDRCTQIICKSRTSYFVLFRWKNQNISKICYVWSSSPPHNKKSIDWKFQMFVDVSISCSICSQYLYLLLVYLNEHSMLQCWLGETQQFVNGLNVVCTWGPEDELVIEAK